jgi:hypothetical protein
VIVRRVLKRLWWDLGSIEEGRCRYSTVQYVERAHVGVRMVDVLDHQKGRRGAHSDHTFSSFTTFRVRTTKRTANKVVTRTSRSGCPLRPCPGDGERVVPSSWSARLHRARICGSAKPQSQPRDEPSGHL